MILQELNRYYERLLADPERDVPARHWSVEKAAWELKLSRDGRLLGAYQLTTGTGKELRRFVSLRVPEHTTRSGTGMLPFFLCDNAAYLLGYDEKRGPEKLASAHALHEAVLGECDDEGAQAVLRFFERGDRDADLDEGVRSELAEGGGFAVFRLDGDRGSGPRWLPHGLPTAMAKRQARWLANAPSRAKRARSLACFLR